MNNSAPERSSASRFRLLTSVSAVALIASLSGNDPALAQGTAEPPIWLEIGWHFDTVSDSQKNFAVPFGGLLLQSPLSVATTQPLDLGSSYGNDGKITFRPEDTDLVFSASVRYGRARGKSQRRIDETQTFPTSTFVTFHTTIPTYPFPYHRTYTQPLQQTQNKLHGSTFTSESHFMLDFEAGMDVGLGIFGRNSTSTLGIGVRFAQLKTVVNVPGFTAVPDAHMEYFHYTNPTFAFFPPPTGTITVPWYKNGYHQIWHDISGSPQSSHEYRGLGPMVYWDASAPLFGDTRRYGQISLDWGANAGVLFGKQKNKIEHRTTGNSHCAGINAAHTSCPPSTHYTNNTKLQTQKRVTVPNLGGYLGVSYQVRNFKLSMGYRADYFLHALDTGVPGQGSDTRSFRGIFASLSIGLGD